MSELAQVKLCSDSQCDRKGRLLPLSEFGKNCRKKDRLSIYCRECSRRRNSEQWQLRKNRVYAETGAKVRKPAKVDHVKVTADVLMAVENGHRTREQIEVATKLNEELIADALADLWDRDRVRIANGNYYVTAKAA